MKNFAAFKQTVLIVEDLPLVRMTAVDVLEDEGFEVLAAANANEALTLLKTRSDVKALVTDIEMPGDLNGLSLAWKARLTHPRIALVIASGRKGNSLGIVPAGTRFFEKPYRPEMIAAEIHQMTGA